MIVSKPKRSTLVSLSLFILLVAALTAATINSITNSTSIYWYHYVFLVILIPVGSIVLIKMLLSYKVTTIGKGKISSSYPIRFKKDEYHIKEIQRWEEVTIKTATGVYKQLEIIFNNNKKFTLGMQEHSNYERAIAYLSKKAPKKRIK